MAGLKRIPSGPFLRIGSRKLIWVGVPEKCDCCGETYPMCWITFDGKRYLCTSCNYDLKENCEAYLEECDLCHYEFPISHLSINYNQLLCRK